MNMAVSPQKTRKYRAVRCSSQCHADRRERTKTLQHPLKKIFFIYSGITKSLDIDWSYKHIHWYDMLVLHNACRSELHYFIHPTGFQIKYSTIWAFNHYSSDLKALQVEHWLDRVRGGGSVFWQAVEWVHCPFWILGWHAVTHSQRGSVRTWALRATGNKKNTDAKMNASKEAKRWLCMKNNNITLQKITWENGGCVCLV